MSSLNYTGQKDFFAARYLYEVLCENEFDIDNNTFLDSWNILKNIDVAKHLDFLLNPELEELVDKYSFDKLFILWKDDFQEFDVSDIIENKKIIAKCYFTIWLIDIDNDEILEEEY
jgi:hypothetical protein